MTPAHADQLNSAKPFSQASEEFSENISGHHGGVTILKLVGSCQQLFSQEGKLNAMGPFHVPHSGVLATAHYFLLLLDCLRTPQGEQVDLR